MLEWVAYPFSRRSSWHRNRTGVSCLAGRQVTLGTNTVVEFYAWKESNRLFSLVLADFFFHQKRTRLLHDATLIFLDSCIDTLFFQNYSYWNSTLFAVEQNTVQNGCLFGFCFNGSFPDSSVGKESSCNAGDPSSIPGSGRSGGERIGYPLQYS